MTTIVLVRKNNEVVVAGDGQVSMGNTVVKSTASKVRKIDKRNDILNFLGKNNFHRPKLVVGFSAETINLTRNSILKMKEK